mmetsp:Transcript_1216/g.3426  ORF Transcript_1216/g.3426 Transcript_1216/m.3426 type:complete len:205 (+) Transcript_1216:571-1185(+)
MADAAVTTRTGPPSSSSKPPRVRAAAWAAAVSRAAWRKKLMASLWTISTVCAAPGVGRPKDARFWRTVVMLAGDMSTKTARPTPRESASRPTEPEPAKTSRMAHWSLRASNWTSIEKSASRTFCIIGRKYTSGLTTFLPLALPATILKLGPNLSAPAPVPTLSTPCLATALPPRPEPPLAFAGVTPGPAGRSGVPGYLVRRLAR